MMRTGAIEMDKISEVKIIGTKRKETKSDLRVVYL